MRDVRADGALIKWLLHESGVSRYKISKDLGISEATLSRLTRDEVPLASIRFGYASMLTEYAREIQAEQAHEGEGTT